MYTCMPYRLIWTRVHHTRSSSTTAFTFSHHQHWGAGARRKFPIIGRCGCSGCCPQALILITRNEPAALVSMKHAPTMVGHQQQAIIISTPRRSSEPISTLSHAHMLVGNLIWPVWTLFVRGGVTQGFSKCTVEFYAAVSYFKNCKRPLCSSGSTLFAH